MDVQDLRSFESWTSSLRYWTGLGVTEEDRLRHESARVTRTARQQCRKCEEDRDYLLKYSPIITFIQDKIKRVNGNLGRESIKCVPCEDMRSGAFHPELGIILCQNRLLGRSHTEDTLSHEMIHAYDQCRFQVDWSNLRHHACAEVRATSLSGECRWTKELGRGMYSFMNQHQECVRRRAALSVRGHPKCKDDTEAARMVNDVFDICFQDTRPFDEIYR